jgi:hypothetical protein
VAWQPFDCSADPAARWRSLSWLPFAATYRGHPLNAPAQVPQKVALFLPLGHCSGRGCVRGRRAPNLAARRGGAPAVAGVPQVGQVFLATRSPGPAGVLVQSAGAFLGRSSPGGSRRPPARPVPARGTPPAGLEEALSALRQRTARPR